MPTQDNPALLLARREKRLLFWRRWLGQPQPSEEHTARIRELCGTYSLLLSKVIKAHDEKEKAACDERLADIERQLTSLFETRRLMTSSLGIPAVGDSPLLQKRE